MIDRKQRKNGRIANGYADRAVVTRAIAMARADGIPINSIELKSNGWLRVSASRPADATTAEAEFDRWDAAGLL